MCNLKQTKAIAADILGNIFMQFTFSFKIIYLYVCGSVSALWMLVPMEARREGLEFPRTGVTGGCESPHVGAGDQTLVLWKSTECS